MKPLPSDAPKPFDQTVRVAPAPAAPRVPAVPRVSSEQLFADGAVELHIDHRGVLYRLKQTALGKLILTK